MSLLDRDSGNQGAEESNFFWLSDYTRRDIFFSILKPNSSKTSLSSSTYNNKSRPASLSERSMSSANTIINDNRISNTPTLIGVNADPNADQLEKGVQEETKWKPGRKEWLVMITLAVSSLTVALDALILVPVLPILAAELHGSATDAFWAGTSFVLTSAVTQPFIASLSDIFGRRELLIPSLLLFTIASIICGVAQNFTVLLIGRVIQGIGGGGVIGLSQIIYGDIVPLRQRPKYFSLVLGAWAIGTLLGPIVGGAFAQGATWRWCFYLNLPICSAATVMAWFCVKLHTEHKTIIQKLKLVDWAGGLAFTTSLSATLIAISSGGVDYPWSSWHIIVPLALGLVGLIATGFYERFAAKNPFLQRSLFPNFSAAITYLSGFFQGLLLFMITYYVTFYFSSAKLASPLMSGVKLSPALAFALPSAIVISALITRLGTYRWAIWIGWATATLGSGLLLLWDEHTPMVIHAVVLSILGLGLGNLLSSINFATQASVVDTRDSGRAAAMYAFMRTLGMTVGVAIGGTIFQNCMKTKLRELGLDESIVVQAEAFVVEVLHARPRDDPMVVESLKAYVYGFRMVFLTLTVISGVAMLLTVFIKQYSMDRILESKYSLKKQRQVPPSPVESAEHGERQPEP